MVDAEARQRIAELEEANRQLRHWISQIATNTGDGMTNRQIHGDLEATGGSVRPDSLPKLWLDRIQESDVNW